MTQRRAGIVAGVVFAAVLAAVGCGGGDGADGAAGGEAAGGGAGLSSGGGEGADDGATDAEVPDDVVVIDGNVVAVSSLDNTFRVQNIQVAPGTTVTWSNDGRNEHDVLPVEGDAWGVETDAFQPGDAYQHTFDEPGVYPYYCSIHGTTTAGMIGTVVVADRPAD
jgi:plastocyanin